MTISALTQDDLKEPDCDKTQLTRLNQLIAALGSSGTEALSMYTLTIVGPATTNGVTVNTAASAATSSSRRVFARTTGTCDTTSGVQTQYAVTAEVTATKSAGASALTNVGVFAKATGGDVNMALDADNGGDVALCGASDKLGFYGTSPIAKQTGVAVSAAGIHAALVALGLIAA